ncbi:MAG: 2TM domain-containing protein [Saprospiraceae bacterium]|nr:2TM domain-containing protein [Saprospiraceae bacterium]
MKNNYEIAKAIVTKKKQLYTQALGFFGVLVVGAIVFSQTYSQWFEFLGFWFYFIMLACGISLVYRYFTLFGLPEFIQDIISVAEIWEERAIQQEMKQRETSSKEQDEFLNLDELESRPIAQRNEESQDDSDLVRMPSR